MAAPALMDDDAGSEEPTETPDAPTYGDTAVTPYLLDPGTDPKAICKFLHDEWAAQHERYARRLCELEVNKRRRNGEGNLWVTKVQDHNLFRVYESYGGKFNQFYQKAGRLCLRLVAVLHQDPAEPEAVPSTGESQDQDAAEFATRILKDLISETGLNQHEAHKQAFDWASNGGSAYVWYKTDPYGGGRQPIEVEAAPQHTTIQEAESMTVLDPMTGQPVPYTGPTVTKYVTPTGDLTDNPAQAAKRWVPKVTREVVEFPHVRLLPADAADIWDASGILYAKYHTWATLTSWFPELKELPEEERDHAIAFRLRECDHLLPKRNGKPYDPKPKEGHENDGLALLMIKWCVEGPEYPEGAYIVTVGDQQVPHRGTWMIEGKDGNQERRDLPLTQVLQWRGDASNPTGFGTMDFLGPSNEARGEITGQVLDMLDKALNPITFAPIGSTITDDDLNNPLNTIVPIQPGFEPKRFEGPKIPGEAFKMLDSINMDMNDATGMGQASAEGMEAPNVNSGRHALAIQAAEKASLSDLNQNVNRALVRGWRIILQCVKADYDAPQLLRYIDRDGDYKVKRWLGSDLGTTRDVQIKRGTGTLFNPAQKAEWVAQYAQMAQIPPEDVRELLASGFSPYTSIQDDEHLTRIRRQIGQWEEGPPAGWTPPPPPPPPMVQGVDQMGQPIMAPQPPPPPYDPVFGADQRPVDTTPVAAATRIRELGKTMAGTKYGAMPPEWKDALNQEFARMQQAMTPPPPPMAPAPGKGAAPQAPQLSPAEQAAAGGP